MASPANVVVGALVWVEDPDVAWIDGEVIEVNGQDVKICCSSGKTVISNKSNVYPKDTEESSTGVDDMTKLAYLHEPGVLKNLKSRFDLNEIYTYTGSILIAVNPFRRLPHLYDLDVMKQYKGASLGDLSPHPFAIADSAYRLMMHEHKSQSILVSGESGAGKTESTKMLMRYLAYMGGTSASEGRTVEQQVLESNPVLEAFGNAKTVRNNNSSRFGKFVEIQFDKKGRISGAAVRTYLLERSRVCQISEPERNYHCFYMLCSAPPEDIEKYKLDNPRTFHYLNQSNCFELDGVNEAEEYLATRKAMDVVGISSSEQDAIFRVVAAVLHLGNVEFGKGKDADSSEPKNEKSKFHLETAADLLMCDVKALEDSLCKRVIVTRDESITKSLDPNSASLTRDAFAKVVYSRLFDWLVNKINNSIGQDPNSKFLIGVLDIYGFESFKTNSFEQFCINLTNEKLQQHFNQHVFKMEQEEYTREEINWSYIEFIDNQDILDLIEKKPGGIIALLDEACMFPRSTHETFAQKLYQTFKDSKRFSKPKLSRTDFTINHYAGDVTYQTELFLDKNKDYVVAEHQALLSASTCSFVSGLFPPLPEESSKSSKFSSIGSRFKQQLQSLLETLSSTEPHYVRCIKPNNVLKPSIFENSNVLQQLRCGGVMEAIRISCAGYPTRRTFDEFVDRFGILSPDVLGGRCDEVSACKKLIEKVGIQGYQIGKTKVFLRAGQMAELDGRRTEVLGRSASVIQRKTRSYMARERFISLRQSAICIQASCRGITSRKLYENMQREAASIKIQTYIRGILATSNYNRLLHSAISLQTGLRGISARSELHFRRQTRAAIIIQAQSRAHLASLHYKRLKRAAIVTQCAWRGRLARRELRKLKMAAKETGALQAAKDKLEKQVEELTLSLQLEKRMRADVEEAKLQEIATLEAALQDMKLEVKETKEMLSREREAAKILAVEQASIIKEVPVVNMEIVDQLTSENEKLKALVNSLEKKVDEVSLQDMEFQLKETKEMLLKEREASKRLALLQAPFIQEVPVVDMAITEQLASENENLKDMEHQVKKTNEMFLKQQEEAKIPSVEQASVIREVLGVDMAIIEQLTSENENLKALVNSLEKNVAEAALKDVELQVQEPKEMLMEREAAKTLPVEQDGGMKDVPGLDMAIIEKLTCENGKLKALVGSLEKKVDEAERNCEEAHKLSEERKKMAEEAESKLFHLRCDLEKKVDETERKYEETLKFCEERKKWAEEAESKLIQMKCTVQSLEEKVSDMESENQILRKQNLPTSPVKSAPESQTNPSSPKILENGHTDADIVKTKNEPQSLPRTKKVLTESDSKARKTFVDRHDVDALIKCVRQNLGFIQGKPVAAFTIYKCLLRWKSFEADKTSVFDRLIQMFGEVLEDGERNEHLAYWLSNTSALLLLLQKSLKPPGSIVSSPKPPLSFFGRMTQSFRSSSASLQVSLDVVRQVEAKYPAMLFKEQLTAYVEKIYGIVRDNLKKELTSFLSSCMEAPGPSKASMVRSASGEHTPSSDWQSIIDCLNGLLLIYQEAFVPHVLVQKTFMQIFSYINVQLFNSLLLRREFCSFSNGEYIKAGLAELELWCCHAKEEYAGSSWDELKHIRQAVGFLVIHHKPETSYDELSSDLCPVLSVQQLYRICTLYWDDKYGTHSVSPTVISSMKASLPEDCTSPISNDAFLLEDDPSIPFSAGEILNSVQEKDFTDIKPPQELVENPAFHFLE